MEQSKALQVLLEAADLIKMVDDFMLPGNVEKLSPAAQSGMRITLRNVRQAILTSHDAIAQALIAQAKRQGAAMPAPSLSEQVEKTRIPPLSSGPMATDEFRASPGDNSEDTSAGAANPITRKDLRATLGRVLERATS